MRYRWQVQPPLSPEQRERLASFHPLLAQLLYNRGIAEEEGARRFLAASAALLVDPFLLPGVEAGAARLFQALLRGELVAIYGDFDVDGVTATALLCLGLQALGGRTVPYIPHRLSEGYGLNLPALEALGRQGVSLVVTVDCGITALSEAAEAGKLGLNMIITDHHVPLPELPRAEVVINPRLHGYPFPHLAGVGVAWKLLQGLHKLLGREMGEEFLDLVALGTVADAVPLVGENRYLVKRGLELLRSNPRLGLKELLRQVGLAEGKVDAEAIDFILGPRLNAAGRMDHAILSYRILATSSQEEASSLARTLEEKNAQRQRLTDEVMARTRGQLSPEEPFLMFWGEDFFPGIVGVVAGKLADEFHRPALVLHKGEEISRGSARSVPGLDLVEALSRCADLLLSYGGHAGAAGLTLPSRNLEALQNRLREIAATCVSLEAPPLVIDAQLPLSYLVGAGSLISQMEPFGQGNPAPTFLSRRVKLVDSHSIGNSGRHLRLKLREGNTIWYGIAFDAPPLPAPFPVYLDIVYRLGVEPWGEEPAVELEVLDFLPPS